MDGWHGAGSFLTQPLLTRCITHEPDRAREQESEHERERETERGRLSEGARDSDGYLQDAQ